MFPILPEEFLKSQKENELLYTLEENELTSIRNTINNCLTQIENIKDDLYNMKENHNRILSELSKINEAERMVIFSKSESCKNDYPIFTSLDLLPHLIDEYKKVDILIGEIKLKQNETKRLIRNAMKDEIYDCESKLKLLSSDLINYRNLFIHRCKKGYHIKGINSHKCLICKNYI